MSYDKILTLNPHSSRPSRRQFLRTCAGVILAGSSSLSALAGQVAPASAFHAPEFDLAKGSRTISLIRESTGERINRVYMVDGKWEPRAYEEICHILRDVQAAKTVQMDVRLIAILDWTGEFLRQYGYTKPIHVLSGYRSPATNARTEGAAQSSLHLRAMAADIYAPGISADYLAKLFRWLSAGGVGVYPSRNFVHVDPGRVRTWRG